MMNEKIRKLILKVKALAERGIGGEKTNAKERLEHLLFKHNITIEELEEIEETVHHLDFKNERLAHQVVAHVLCKEEYFTNKEFPNRIYYECTTAKHIEIFELYEFHETEIERQIGYFYTAYMTRNGLTWNDGNIEEEKEITEEDKRVFEMMRIIERKSLIKKIG